MSKPLIITHFATIFYLFFTTFSYADCLPVTAHCEDGTEVKIDSKFDWHEMRCIRMKRDATNSVDVAQDFCKNHGGLKRSGE